MAKAIRKLAIGAALSLLCMACTAAGGHNPSTDASPADRFTPLSRLKPIDLDGDPLSETETFHAKEHESPKAIGEVRTDRYRIIAYTEGSSCGILVVDAKSSKKPSINIVSAWPKNDSDGIRRYAAGPYSFASGAGADGSHSRASMYCSESAMVIEYSAKGKAQASGRQGHVSIKERHSVPESLIVTVGSDAARKKIRGQI
ncbi:hypothetical protein IPZ61_23015 [Streptomyces sioyaensis]|uniref:hypothetical protein n=1 Tax=Streptomyces sioyaensis TaxID=67364 RepID=UPI001F1E6E31|nr:hypothetical protein [Streptomyces sioyaensis]MCF3176177.1 hypothetical protein [Streptomyces sioyaensis]